MRTARSRSLALVTCQANPEVSPDDALLQAALRERGVDAVAAAWNDPDIDWRRFSALAIRSTWDYHTQYQAFRRWLRRIDAMSIRVVNPVETIRWNSDKRYLFQLAWLGVGVIPTRLALGADLHAAVSQMAGRRLVVKPVVSGNSWNTVQGVAGSAELRRQIESLPARCWYLVQPYLPEIESDGEWSLVYLGREFSHAVRKMPAAGDYRVQEGFGGAVIADIPSQEILAATRSCLEAVAQAGHGSHVYARVDGVVSAGVFQLMEVELIEPVLFLRSNSDAAARLSDAIASCLYP